MAAYWNICKNRKHDFIFLNNDHMTNSKEWKFVTFETKKDYGIKSWYHDFKTISQHFISPYPNHIAHVLYLLWDQRSCRDWSFGLDTCIPSLCLSLLVWFSHQQFASCLKKVSYQIALANASKMKKSSSILQLDVLMRISLTNIWAYHLFKFT